MGAIASATEGFENSRILLRNNVIGLQTKGWIGNMTHYAIVAGTPYTLMSAIKLAINILPEDSIKDLYVRSINNMDECISRLKSESVFNHIYTFKMRNKEHSFRYYLHDLKQAMLPRTYLKEILEDDIKLEEKDYQYISITSGFDVEMALVRVFPDAKQIAIDDGLGSYVGDIVHDHKLSWVWRIFGRDNTKIQPEVLYVNNSEACKSILTKNIRSIKGDLSRGIIVDDIITRVFDYRDAGEYENALFIYLTQPVRELGFKENAMDDLTELLRVKLGNNIIVRIHPRDVKKYPGFTVDMENQLWELLCKEKIDESKCLIGICSTAHIMPKILFNIEPTIIFLYKLLEWKEDDEAFIRFANIEKMITDMYRDKSKVIVPNSLSEFKADIEEMVCHE